MSRTAILVAPLAMFALASSVFAGGPDCAKNAKNAAYMADHKGCTATKEECLKHMAEAKNRGWLGIKYEESENGMSVVQDVVKGSPAERAGFRSGDVLFALNGIQMNEANSERVASTWKALKPGSVVSYTVKREGTPKDLTVTLGTMPDDIYQAMVTEHMKEHTEIAKN
jgi:predicted metalloprotease with PDZ domain